MKFLGFILIYSLVWLIHLLPDPLLYLISDFLSMLNYHIFRYRRKVVMENLSIAFPERGRAELKKTARKFYRHLTDLMLESAIFPFFSRKRAMKKISFRNMELLEDLHSRGRMVMAATAHYGNWEYLSVLPLASPYPVIAIYKPLHNKYFDRWTIRNRTKYGVDVTPMGQIARSLLSFQKEGQVALALFLADQSPAKRHIQYWTEFMGRMTPVHLGTEKLARKLDSSVVFIKVSKIKRGSYEIEPELICEDPGSLDQYEITIRHVKALERLIREKPEHWLWSHRRWKHTYS